MVRARLLWQEQSTRVLVRCGKLSQLVHCQNGLRSVYPRTQAFSCHMAAFLGRASASKYLGSTRRVRQFRNSRQRASCGLQELLEHKIRSGSKFSGSVRESREITVSISPNWVVNLSSSSGEDLNWAFQAWEERFALFLALNRAVRRVAGCARSTPLIVDGELGMYPDPVLRLTIRPFLDSLSEQVVVLDRCGTIARLGPSRRTLSSWSVMRFLAVSDLRIPCMSSARPFASISMTQAETSQSS
jgi:hypothetical protein